MTTTDIASEVRPPARRRFRTVVLTLSGVLVLAVLFVVMLPTLVNWGLFRGLITGQVSGLVNGTVVIDDLEIGWSGPLRVGSLKIDDPQNHSSVEVLGYLDQGLWTIITHGTTKLSGHVEATVKTRKEADGSLAIAKMFKSGTDASATGGQSTPPTKTSDKALFPAGTELNFGFGPIVVIVEDADGSPQMSVNGVNGQLELSAGGKASLNIGGDAQYQDRKGSFVVKATADGIIGSDGALVIKGVPVNVQVETTSLELSWGDVRWSLDSAGVSVVSKDLSKHVDVDVAAKGLVNQSSMAELKAALTVDHPLTAEGAPAVDLGAIKGTLSGKGIPTAPFQALVGESPLVFSRDVGSTLDFDGSFSEASGKGISFNLRSEQVKVAVEGSVDPATQAAALSSVAVEADVDPALMELAGIKVSGRSKVTLNAHDVVIPARAADGAFPTDALEFRATLAAAFRDAVVRAGTVEKPLGVSALQVSANAKPVKSGVEFTLSATPVTAKLGEAAVQPVASTMRAKGVLVPGGRLGAHGSVEAAGIPTALIDPWLPEGMPLRLADELGPVITGLTVSADAGESTSLSLALDSAGLKVNAKGSQGNDGSVKVESATLAAPAIRPELLAKWGVQVEDAVKVQLRATEVVLPPSMSLAEMAGRVVVDLSASKGDAILLKVGGGQGAAPRTLQIRATKLVAHTAGVGREVSASLDSIVDGSALTATVNAKELLNSAKEWVVETAALNASFKVGPLSRQQLASQIPDAKEFITALQGDAYSVDGTFVGTLSNAQIGASVGGGPDQFSIQAALRPEALTADVEATLVLTPALVKASAGDLPFELAKPAHTKAVMNGVSMPRDGMWGFETPTKLLITTTSPEILLRNVSGVATEVKLSNVSLTKNISLVAPHAAKGTARMSVGAVGANGEAFPVADADVAFDWTGGPAGGWLADADMTAIDGAGVEELLAVGAESRGRFGKNGSARVKASQGADGALVFDVQSQTDMLRAKLNGRLAQKVLTLQPSTAELQLPGSEVVKLLNGANEDKSKTWANADPLFLSLDVKSLRMGVGATQGTGFKLPSDFSAVVDVSVKPITLTPVTGAAVKANTATLSVNAPGIDQPATLRGRVDIATLASGSTPAAGNAAINFDASLRDWATSDGALAHQTMRVDSVVKIEKASTAIVGLLLGMGSELTEAVGPTITADLKTTSTGAGSATVVASVDSQYLVLRAPRVVLDKGFVVVTADKPLTLNFHPSPPLRERLLEPINPIFTDISLADPTKPIVLEASAVRYPISGDYALLDGDMQLRVGAVNLARNKDNQLLNLLKIFQTTDNKPIEGQIDPLTVAVRAGQLTYKDFKVNIEKQGNTWVTQLIFSGDINLARKPPVARSIAANYPMGSIARQFLSNVPAEDGGAELQGVFGTLSAGALDAVQLRISFSGVLGEVDGKPVALRRKIKVELKPEAIGKGIGDVVKDAGGILKDIFGKPKKAPPPKP